MSRLRLLAATVVVLVPTFASAQQVAETPDPTNAAVEKKATDLLDRVISRIANLRNPDNRIAASCAVADLLWSRDEKRARGLFDNVTKEVTSQIASIDFGDQQAYETVSSINSRRQEIVGRLARHDPELALKFLRATRFPDEGQSVAAAWERNLELSLSRTVAAKDPDRALQIARESLSKGLSYEIVGLLMELSQKDKAAAESLYQSVINTIKDGNLAGNNESANIALNLVSSFQPPQANERLYRELLNSMIKYALSLNLSDPATVQMAQNFRSNFSSLNESIEKYLPDQAPAIKDWLRGLTRTLDPQSQMYAELNDINQKGSVEDLLALASKYPAEMRNQVYQQAAWKAMNDGDIGRARQIAEDYVSDAVQRRQLLNQFESQLIWKSINANDLSEARALLSKTLPVDQRIELLTRIASMLMAKDNKKEALQCLNEARTVIASLPNNSSRMWRQLQLANAYAAVDLDQSFGLVQGIVTHVNELVAAAVVMDGFENRYLKRGEWMINGGSSLANVVSSTRNTLAQLAKFDFERAETLSDQLERPEIRLMAQLDIVQAVLNIPASSNVATRVFLREK